MKKLSVLVLGGFALSTVASMMPTPASALGGCGPNGHRNYRGQCVFGGQRQNWCLRTKGHPAVRMPDGTLRCI
ncbi:hypothetical protein FF100_22295 [Methylobacterium terricola]|uniref:Uncharacterized protein n=1 Tax=Methylobacterium terricola TaxID=2583531 RepID=A0A5C4LCZ9_9HYPH|nr:hypothetical protein FF100_22295 [Methylobacterium terricola]